ARARAVDGDEPRGPRHGGAPPGSLRHAAGSRPRRGRAAVPRARGRAARRGRDRHLAAALARRPPASADSRPASRPVAARGADATPAPLPAGAHVLPRRPVGRGAQPRGPPRHDFQSRVPGAHARRPVDGIVDGATGRDDREVCHGMNDDSRYETTAVLDEPGAAGSDRWLFAAFLAALALLVFLAGSLLTAAGLPPGPQVERAWQAGRAWYAKLFHYDNVYFSDLWHPARTERRGVTVNVPELVSPGVTLYTSGHEASAFLVSMDGEVLHRWHRPFSQVWNETAAVKEPQPDSHVYMRKATLLPTGELLAIY